MGLLDILGSGTPQADTLGQGLLGLGAGLLSGGAYGALGPALGRGLLGFQQGEQNAQAMQQRQVLADLQRQQVQAKLAQQQGIQSFFAGLRPQAAAPIQNPDGSTSYPVSPAGSAPAPSTDINDSMINQALMSGNPTLMQWGMSLKRLQADAGGSFAPQQSTSGYFHMNKDGTIDLLKDPTTGKPLMPITADPGTQGAVARAKGFGAKSGQIEAGLPMQARQAQNVANAAGQQYDRLAQAAQDLLNAPGLDATLGVQGMFPNLPGGAAADAEALKKTLTSQVAFSTLQSLRDMSKTGGALGQVSDKEEQMLANNLAALDKAQSPEQYRQSLQKIIDFTRQSKGRLQSAYQNMYGQTAGAAPANSGGDGVPAVQDAAAYNQLPSGTVFRAPDGSLRRKP